MSEPNWPDVERVLAAVIDLPSAERSVRIKRLCAHNPELQGEVEALLAAHESADSLLQTTLLRTGILRLAIDEEEGGRIAGDPHLPTDGEIKSALPVRIERYRIIRLIAEGGMGQVWLAEQTEPVKRQVALKLIKPGQVDTAVLQRFQSERQSLAIMDHPSIAKVFDAGVTRDGQPYFVMEYVPGAPITDYCDQKKLKISERLELFIKVCEGVQHAHQKAVIHRDLKPANILVVEMNGKPQPRIIDFGLAKGVSPQVLAEAQFTLAGSFLGTPGYMSPERAEPCGQVDTRTDVYSLGVILYVLLTGWLPFETQVSLKQPLHEVLRQLCEEDPPRPSTKAGTHGQSTIAVAEARGTQPKQLISLLRGDLDWITMKALERNRERRYASVEQFSEDIRRHLDGLPVIARTDTFGYRSVKFIKRHTAGVTAAALVVLSLTIGLSFALREAKIAREQRVRAEQRFNDVRTLANSLIFDVHDSIADVPGTTSARKLIVDKAIHYLDSLSRESQGDLSLQRELAAGYKRIGDVQGNAWSANLGDSAGSLASYQKALEIRKAVLAVNPTNVTDAINLAQSLHCVADSLVLKGETDKAWKYSQRSVETIEPFVNSHPNNLPVLQELATDYTSEASILAGNFNVSSLGDTANALVVRQKEVSVREKVLQLDPNDGNKGKFAKGLTLLGDQFLLVGDRHTALDYYFRSQKMFEDLASDSTGREAQNRLYSVYNRIYTAQQANGNLPEALLNAQRALKIAQHLSQADPHDVYSRVSLVLSYGNLADVLSSMHRFPAARSAMTQAIAIVDPLVASNPTNGEFQGVEASTYVIAGDVFRRSEDYDRSLHDYQVALKIFSQIHLRDPSNVDAGLELAGAYNQLGKLLVLRGELDGAAQVFHKGLAISELQTTAQNPNEESLYSAAESYAGLAKAEANRITPGQMPQIRITHLNQARLWDEHSLQLWSKVKEPGFLSPDGYDSEPPSMVKQHLARVNSELAELKDKSHSPAVVQ